MIQELSFPYDDFDIPAFWRKIFIAECFFVLHDLFGFHEAAQVSLMSHKYRNTNLN